MLEHVDRSTGEIVRCYDSRGDRARAKRAFRREAVAQGKGDVTFTEEMVGPLYGLRVSYKLKRR